MKKLFLILLIFISIILLFPWVACYNTLPQYTYHGIVPAGMAFLCGDGDSFDSRYYGPLQIKLSSLSSKQTPC